MKEGKVADGTVAKALDVLERIASFERPIRFRELLPTSPYPKATLFRFVQTLTQQNMLRYDDERQTYAPGMRLVRLAHAAWQQSSLAPIARPYLDDLSRQTGETVHLAQIDSGQVLYVDKRNAQAPLEMYSQAGKIGPAYCTGVGKAMLAFMQDPQLSSLLTQQSYHRFTETTLCSEEELRAELALIRKKGYAYDQEEHEPTIICIAVPILSHTGKVLGALSLTSSTLRTSLVEMTKFNNLMHQTALQIAQDADNWTAPDRR